jgi:hypothetical protein
LTWNCLRAEPAWFLNNLPLFSQLQWGVIFGVRGLSFFWSLFFFFFTISHHDSLVYVMREICWRRRSYWETGEKKQLSRVLITLRTVAERKFWRRRSALVSGRWYYCKNVTSGLLAEESQRRRRRRKIADQLANVGRQIGKDFATCNKNREVLLANCRTISPKNYRKRRGGRKTHFAIVNEEV